MEENTVNPKNTGEKKEIVRNPDGTFVKGFAPNPSGRPKGSRNFTTDFEEAIKGIKDKDTGQQLTIETIIKTGIIKMMKGDARFEGLYKDLLDRVYGKAHQTSDITSGGEPISTLTESEKEKLNKLLDDK